jgi:hypothetical protein
VTGCSDALTLDKSTHSLAIFLLTQCTIGAYEPCGIFTGKDITKQCRSLPSHLDVLGFHLCPVSSREIHCEICAP